MDQPVEAITAVARIDWSRWMPAIAPDAPNRWRLIRFDLVDGQPHGKPVASMTPQGTERRFPNERQAQWGADELNRQEGR